MRYLAPVAEDAPGRADPSRGLARSSVRLAASALERGGGIHADPDRQRSHPRAGERRLTTSAACGEEGRRFWAGQPWIRETLSAKDAARSLPRSLPQSACPIPRRASGCAWWVRPLRDGIAFVDIKTQRDGCAQARVDDNLVGGPLHRPLCARRDVT